ncbi:cupin domain-containing protein [Rufibacter hautae]|uniref:Cupin domain-containing protein n=1 Tax=Rufibacter hautae TaxID=2595005 RepID=A0A5B6TBX8_9BACT|nr:cupin domain-containing protein [Rufibacter hautae]KAA3437120.1 cupin domain-containing protein [Rufibacter hautae]
MAHPTQAPEGVQLENLANKLEYQTSKFAHQILLDQEHHKTHLFAFAKGQELKTHTTPTAALLIMLEGTCSFHIHGTSQLLQPGAIIMIPATVPHSLNAETDFKMVLVK